MGTLTNRVRFHPNRLTDSEIVRCRNHAKELHHHAPAFFDWLSDFLRAEQQRRLRLLVDTYEEPQLAQVEFEMSNDDLADALKMVTVFSYTVETYELGRFFDELNNSLIAMTSNRLRNLEQWLP